VCEQNQREKRQAKEKPEGRAIREAISSTSVRTLHVEYVERRTEYGILFTDGL